MSAQPALLSEGDIIELQPGQHVYITLPAHVCYSNKFGCFTELGEATITIGEIHGGLDTSIFAGRYVVVSAASGGGGGRPGDEYPHGWRVTCQRMMSTKLSLNGPSMCEEHPLRVSFYQTGCFTAMNPDIKPIGRARAEWKEP